MGWKFIHFCAVKEGKKIHHPIELQNILIRYIVKSSAECNIGIHTIYSNRTVCVECLIYVLSGFYRDEEMMLESDFII